MLCLQHGIGNPPVGPLVDVDEDNFPGHVQLLVVPHGSLACIDQLCGNALRGSGGGGIGIDRVFFAIYGKAGAVELPAIAGSCGFFHICEANLRHNAGQIVRSGVLGIAAGVPAAQGRVEVLRICSQLQGDVIGKIRRDSVHKAIVHSLEGGRLLLGRLGGSRGLLAGGEPQKYKAQEQCGQFLSQCFSS